MFSIANLTAFVTGFFLLSIWAKEIVLLIFDAILSPVFGFRMRSVNFFGLGFENSYQGGWHRIPFRASQLITHSTGIHIHKPIPKNIDQREKAFLLLRALFLIACGGLLVFLTRGSFLAMAQMKATIPDWLTVGFSGGFLFHSLFQLGIFIYTYAVAMKRLAGYVQSLIKRMRNGEPISEMNLRPVDELPYPNASKMERMLYYNFYLFYLLRHGDIDGMREPIREMSTYFQNREYIDHEIMSYCWLIFYYSRYDLNPQAAKIFYDRAYPSLIKDNESNARRVLAYYAYGIERDLDKAQQYVREGLAAIDHFSLPGEERETERELLTELQGFIDKARRVPQEVQS